MNQLSKTCELVISSMLVSIYTFIHPSTIHPLIQPSVGGRLPRSHPAVTRVSKSCRHLQALQVHQVRRSALCLFFSTVPWRTTRAMERCSASFYLFLVTRYVNVNSMTADRYRRKSRYSELSHKLQDKLDMIDEALDVALSKTCCGFDVDYYSRIQQAYRLLGKSQVGYIFRWTLTLEVRGLEHILF